MFGLAEGSRLRAAVAVEFLAGSDGQPARADGSEQFGQRPMMKSGVFAGGLARMGGDGNVARCAIGIRPPVLDFLIRIPAPMALPRNPETRMHHHHHRPSARLERTRHVGKQRHRIRHIMHRHHTSHRIMAAIRPGPRRTGVRREQVHPPLRAMAGLGRRHQARTTPLFSPPTGPATVSFSGLHRESNFLAFKRGCLHSKGK